MSRAEQAVVRYQCPNGTTETRDASDSRCLCFKGSPSISVSAPPGDQSAFGRYVAMWVSSNEGDEALVLSGGGMLDMVDDGI